MSLSAKHNTHMNITESRKRAVKIMTKETGLAFFCNDKRIGKGRVLEAIKTGLFDGYFYKANYAGKVVNLHFANPGNYLHKIGV